MFRNRIRQLTVGTAVIAALSIGAPDKALGQCDLSEAIVDVIGWIGTYPDFTLVPEIGHWGLMFGWFEEGEEKNISFHGSVGHRYAVAGGGDLAALDLDICVYDPTGRQVACDRGIDDIPVVNFTAAHSGTYRAMLKAYELVTGSTCAGMVLLRGR